MKSDEGDGPKQWKVKLIDVEVQNVELVREFAHAVEHQHAMGIGSLTLASSRNAVGPSKCCDILRPSVIDPDTERFQTANSRVSFFGTAAFRSFT